MKKKKVIKSKPYHPVEIHNSKIKIAQIDVVNESYSSQPNEKKTIDSPKRKLGNKKGDSFLKIANLKKEIAKESEINSKKKYLPFDTVNVQQLWTEYINEKVDSPSLKAQMKDAFVVVENSILKIKVGSIHGLAAINSQNNLMEYFKQIFGLKVLKKELFLDEDKMKKTQESIGAKPLNPKETFELMASYNSVLNRLHEKFDLKYDNG